MGKKYEAYQKAVQAEGMAKNHHLDTQGGSAKGMIQEAETNLHQAMNNSNDTWNQFIEDPEG